MRTVDLDPVAGGGPKDARDIVLMSFQATRDEEAQPVLHHVNGDEVSDRVQQRGVAALTDDGGCELMKQCRARLDRGRLQGREVSEGIVARQVQQIVVYISRE